MMSTSLTRMPWNTFEAENTQIAGNVWSPQKWPPARTSEMFWNAVGGLAPKPFDRVAEVERADRDARVDQRVRDVDVAERVGVAAVDRDARRPPGEQSTVRFSKTLSCLVAEPPASMAENSAKLSSPVDRASLLVTRLFGAAVGHVDAVGERVPDPRVGDGACCRCWRPSTCTTMCSTQMLSIVMFDDVGEVERPCPGRRCARCSCRSRRSPLNDEPLADGLGAEADVGVLLVRRREEPGVPGPGADDLDRLAVHLELARRLRSRRPAGRRRSACRWCPCRACVQRVLHVLLGEAGRHDVAAPGPGWRSARPARG